MNAPTALYIGDGPIELTVSIPEGKVFADLARMINPGSRGVVERPLVLGMSDDMLAEFFLKLEEGLERGTIADELTGRQLLDRFKRASHSRIAEILGWRAQMAARGWPQ